MKYTVYKTVNLVNGKFYIGVHQTERIEGRKYLNSSYLKGLLAHILDTTIPRGRTVLICHACNNAACSNPSHIYWGTPRENAKDALANGNPNPWQNVVAKYGLEKAKALNKRARARDGKWHTSSP